MIPDETSLRLHIIEYVTGERGDSGHLPAHTLHSIDSIISSLIFVRRAYLQWAGPDAMRSDENIQIYSTPENPHPTVFDAGCQDTSVAVPVLGGTPGTTELARLLNQTRPTVAYNQQPVASNLSPRTPEHRRLSLAERLQPRNFALPDTPVANPLADFESYTVFQLRQSLKQLGKRYLTREHAIQMLRGEYASRGWLPDIHLTQFQLMSPARRQTLEETVTDWIKTSPWYLLILTFVPVNKHKMLEHMKKCKINISLESLSSYLLNNNVLMAEGEETDSTSLDENKLKIRYPKENGEKQLTLSEILTTGAEGRKVRRKAKR